MRGTVRWTQTPKLINEATSILQGEGSKDNVSLRLLYDRWTSCNNELNAVNKELEPLIHIDDIEAELMTAMGNEDDVITTFSSISERIDRLQQKNTSNAPPRLASSNTTTVKRTSLSSGLRIPRVDITPFRGEVSNWMKFWDSQQWQFIHDGQISLLGTVFGRRGSFGYCELADYRSFLRWRN